MQALSFKANKESVEKALRGKADRDELLDKADVVSRRDWDTLTSVSLHCMAGRGMLLMTVVCQRMLFFRSGNRETGATVVNGCLGADCTSGPQAQQARADGAEDGGVWVVIVFLAHSK